MTLAAESNHLQNQLTTKFGAIDAQVVFLDIVSYSKRRTSVQRQVIDQFQKDMGASIIEIGRKYLDYVQNNNLNLSKDVVKIPTGDGAAFVFSFAGLQSAPLDFAVNLLSDIYERLEKGPCERFSEQGWCNCHSHYNVRVGINEGKCILYTDLNGLVNVAGSTMNDAARIMNLSDANQILMSELYHTNIIDMSSDISIEDRIKSLGEVKVKHGRKLNVFQYIGANETFINRDAPLGISLNNEMNKSMVRMGIPPSFMNESAKDPKQMLELVKMMGAVMDQFSPILDQASQPALKKD